MPALSAQHRVAAVWLTGGLAALVVATGLRWNADAIVSVLAGALVGGTLLALRSRRQPAEPVPSVGRALVANGVGVGATLLVSALLGGDGWGVAAVVLLMFGLAEAVRPAAA